MPNANPTQMLGLPKETIIYWRVLGIAFLCPRYASCEEKNVNFGVRIGSARVLDTNLSVMQNARVGGHAQREAQARMGLHCRLVYRFCRRVLVSSRRRKLYILSES